MAVSEVCTEIMFMKTILEFVGVNIKKPIMVNCDNEKAIFVANNAKMTARTKHIDIKYHLIREFIVDGTVKIVFVTSENNNSDVFKKNVNKPTYEELFF